MNSGGSFGANPLRQHIGLGNAVRIVQLEIYWPTSDLTQRFDDVPLDASFEINESDGELHRKSYQPITIDQTVPAG